MYKIYCTVFNKCHQELQYQVVLELKHINILFNTFVDFESYGITYLYVSIHGELDIEIPGDIH